MRTESDSSVLRTPFPRMACEGPAALCFELERRGSGRTAMALPVLRPALTGALRDTFAARLTRS